MFIWLWFEIWYEIQIWSLLSMFLWLEIRNMKFPYDVFMFEIWNMRFKVIAYDMKSKGKGLGLVCLWYEI